MGINTLLRITGLITFEQPWIMTILFTFFYCWLGVIALNRPVAALVMYFGTSIMNPQIHYPIFQSLPMALISAIYCFISLAINIKKASLRFSTTLLCVLFFIITANISSLYAINQALSGQRLNEFNNILLMSFITTLLVKDRSDYSFLFYGIFWSIFFNIMKNLIETQTKGNWVTVRGTAGWLTDSNDWALALAMAIPLSYTALIMNWPKGWKFRTIFTLSTLGALMTLTLTSSRGGFLAAMVSGLVFLLMDRKPKKVALCGAAIVIVIAMYMPNSFLNKINTLAGIEDIATSTWSQGIDDKAEYTGAERVHFWHIAFDVMLDNPLTGVGWGNFIKEMERIEGISFVAHSTWFQVAAEAGITGIACYLLMIFNALIISFKTWKIARRNDDLWKEFHSRSLFCGIIAFCVGASFVSRENSELIFLYIAMAAVLPVLVPGQDKVSHSPVKITRHKKQRSSGGGWRTPKTESVARSTKSSALEKFAHSR